MGSVFQANLDTLNSLNICDSAPNYGSGPSIPLKQTVYKCTGIPKNTLGKTLKRAKNHKLISGFQLILVGWERM